MNEEIKISAAIMEMWQQQLDQIHARAEVLAEDFYVQRKKARDSQDYKEWGTLALFVRKRKRKGSGLNIPVIEWQNIEYFGKWKDGSPRRKQTHITRGKSHTIPMSAFTVHTPSSWQLRWVEMYEPVFGEFRRQIHIITTMIKKQLIADRELAKSAARLEELKLDPERVNF